MIAHCHISIIQGGFQCKLNNGACTIIPYPTVEVKRIWQVYVPSELKIKLFRFFTIRTMVWIFIAGKNRYLNLSAVLQFATTRNHNLTTNESEPKQNNATHSPLQRFTTNFSLPCPQSGRFWKPFINGFIFLGISKMSFSF